MSTTTKTRSKIDLHAMIGPRTKEPEPKTLEECLLEAGGFPFVARAMTRPRYANGWPEGTELRCIGWKYAGCMLIDPQLTPDGTTADGTKLSGARRWCLVGHKT